MYVYIYIYILIFKMCSTISHEKTVSESILSYTFIPLVWTLPVIQKCRRMNTHSLEHIRAILVFLKVWFGSAHVFYASCDYLIVSTFCGYHVFCHTTYVYGSSWDILRRPSKRDHHGSDPIGDSVSNVRTAPLEIGRAPTTGQGLQWESWILLREFSSGSEGKPAMDEWWTWLFLKKNRRSPEGLLDLFSSTRYFQWWHLLMSCPGFPCWASPLKFGIPAALPPWYDEGPRPLYHILLHSPVIKL